MYINSNPLEYTDQCNLVLYLDSLKLQGKDVLYSSIPNSTFTTSWKVKKKNTAAGLRAGLPDMFLVINKNSFWIELKRAKGGKLSTEQKTWVDKIKESGQKVFVCHGFEQAKQVIDTILHLV